MALLKFVHLVCLLLFVANVVQSAKVFPKVLKGLEVGVVGGYSAGKKTDETGTEIGCKRNTAGKDGLVNVDAYLKTRDDMSDRSLEQNGYTFVKAGWNPLQVRPRMIGDAQPPPQVAPEVEDENAQVQEAVVAQQPVVPHEGSNRRNINSLLQSLPAGSWTEWEQRIFDDVKGNLLSQIKPCRRKVGVYGHTCESKNEDDCREDTLCQWFEIEDIKLIKDFILPASLDFESEDHFRLTRKSAHENIWALGSAGEEKWMSYVEARKYFFDDDDQYAVFLSYESRMARRSQLKDFCNKVNKEKQSSCDGVVGGSKPWETCEKSFEVLGDCGTRKDCRLCLVSSDGDVEAETACEWVHFQGEDAKCRNKRDGDAPEFKARELKKCLKYDERKYDSRCFRHKDCTACNNEANCKWAWYETGGTSSASPSPVCMKKSLKLDDVDGATVKTTKKDDDGAPAVVNSCVDYTNYDEHALKRSTLKATPCKWTGPKDSTGHCERDGTNQGKCRNGGAIATRFHSQMFPKSADLTPDDNRRAENTCTFDGDSMEKFYKMLKRYDVTGKGVPDLHIDTNLERSEFMFYLLEYMPVTLRDGDEEDEYYGLDIYNAWGPVDDVIYVAPLALRDDGKDPTDPRYGHKCVKTDRAIDLNYVQAKSGDMWMWKTTHVMHGALYVYDDEILQHTKASHCRSSVEFRFMPITKTKPDILCMHHATVYDTAHCNADERKPCRLVTDDSCHGKFGPGPTRVDDCDKRRNCYTCTMSGSNKCEWVKLAGQAPKCRVATEDEEEKASTGKQCYTKNMLATEARFRSVESATSEVDGNGHPSTAQRSDFELCALILEHSADMGGMPAVIPEPCLRLQEAIASKSDELPSEIRFRGRRVPKALEPSWG